MQYLLSIILNVAVGQNMQSVKIAVGEKCRRSKWLSVKNFVGQNGRRSKLPSVKMAVGQSCVGQKTWNPSNVFFWNILIFSTKNHI
jgi:hypothetical protein